MGIINANSPWSSDLAMSLPAEAKDGRFRSLFRTKRSARRPLISWPPSSDEHDPAGDHTSQGKVEPRITSTNDNTMVHGAASRFQENVALGTERRRTCIHSESTKRSQDEIEAHPRVESMSPLPAASRQEEHD